MQICRHNQAGPGAGIANEAQHLFIADQWLGGPVFGNLREQTVLDRVPFGCAGRIMSDCSRDAEWVAEPSLHFSLPGPGSATVAATRVRQNQNFGSVAMATRSVAFAVDADDGKALP